MTQVSEAILPVDGCGQFASGDGSSRSMRRLLNMRCPTCGRRIR